MTSHFLCSIEMGAPISHEDEVDADDWDVHAESLPIVCVFVHAPWFGVSFIMESISISTPLAVRDDDVVNSSSSSITGNEDHQLLEFLVCSPIFAVPSEWTRQIEMMMRLTRLTATSMESMPQVSPCLVCFHPRALVWCDPEQALKRTVQHPC